LGLICEGFVNIFGFDVYVGYLMVFGKRTRRIFVRDFCAEGLVWACEGFFCPQCFDREEGCQRKKRWRGAEEKASFSVGGGKDEEGDDGY